MHDCAGVSDHDLLYSKMSLDPAAQSAGPAFPAASSNRTQLQEPAPAPPTELVCEASKTNRPQTRSVLLLYCRN